MTKKDCFFPQDSALPELYAAHPNATWVLPLRPVTNWIRSVDSMGTWLQKTLRGLRPYSYGRRRQITLDYFRS